MKHRGCDCLPKTQDSAKVNRLRIGSETCPVLNSEIEGFVC